MELIEGQTISISLGGATGLSCVVSKFIHAKIITITEKAIQIQCKKDTCWLPKSALEQKNGWYKLKNWFKPNGWQTRFFEKHMSINGISSAY